MLKRRFRRFRRCLVPAFFLASMLMSLISAYIFLSHYYNMPQVEMQAGTEGDTQVHFLQYLGSKSLRGQTEGNKSGKRQNLIIVAHGRSGSSFTGNIFNHHPKVFYLFEPYQTAERIHGKLNPFDKDYEEKSLEWMNGVLQCNFVSDRHVQDLDHYYRAVNGKNTRETQISVALSSPPFCSYNTSDLLWTSETCQRNFDKRMLEQACRTKYSMTVVKALFGRMPQTNIKHLIKMCDSSSEFDCKILFLVRDPRGIIPSSQAVNFFRDKDRIGLAKTREFAYLNCKETEENLDILRTLTPRWRKRIKLLRYEDLALNPSKNLPQILEFADLPMDEGLSKWFYLATHKGETNEVQKAHPWREDSAEGANRWRWRVMPYDITVIEHYCQHVMKLLGYKRLNLSYEIQRNTSFSLLEENFEAARWLTE
ncbi:carbohydrate sulfotransferase 1-like isoform X1 [Montipora capricornis]|uniref:carbohydrate sulfotransferase 1-like isoform X1 n=2 Tax=Montipora capricornis TaxID=246305 RepID=UPI0035F1B5FD